MILTHSVKVCLATQPCDLRKSFDTLSCVVEEQLKKAPPFSPSALVQRRLQGPPANSKFLAVTQYIESLLNIIFIARSLERIGDLAKNMAEDVVFITSAEDISHAMTNHFQLWSCPRQVPEPSSALLGLIGCGFLLRRRR